MWDVLLFFERGDFVGWGAKYAHDFMFPPIKLIYIVCVITQHLRLILGTSKDCHNLQQIIQLQRIIAQSWLLKHSDVFSIPSIPLNTRYIVYRCWFLSKWLDCQ